MELIEKRDAYNIIKDMIGLERRDVLMDAYNTLKNLPTIDAAPRWVRCDNPPKYSGKVFVWMEKEGDFFDKEYVADVAYYNNLSGGRIPKGTFFKPIQGKMDYEILDNVTHWMPIEPPREGE